MEKLIITAAVTGGEFISRAQTEYVPCRVDEIVDEVCRCRKEGASIVHLHAKDPESGMPHRDPNPVFPEYIKGIQESEASDIIINITTGGGRWVDPKKLDKLMEERCGFGQEISSLNMGSVNIWEDMGSRALRNIVFSNPLSTIKKWAGYMYRNGVKPELEVYDTGMINTALRFVEEGALKEPLHFQFVMFGGLSCMSPTPKTLMYCVESAPENSTWSVCAPGKYEMPMAAMAIMLGGHVRVGFEDNIYLEKGVLARSNSELVAKAVRIASELGREIAAPDEAREILNLPAR